MRKSKRDRPSPVAHAEAAAPVDTCCPPALPAAGLPVDAGDANLALARLAKALGHPARVSILRTLLQRDTCV
ncbi:MAG: hypothetical protein KC593_00745, partial [Myxococcales bacterium]|nr:hypothetical protein [Myxococcales bacterium]